MHQKAKAKNLQQQSETCKFASIKPEVYSKSHKFSRPMF